MSDESQQILEDKIDELKEELLRTQIQLESSQSQLTSTRAELLQCRREVAQWEHRYSKLVETRKRDIKLLTDQIHSTKPKGTKLETKVATDTAVTNTTECSLTTEVPAEPSDARKVGDLGEDGMPVWNIDEDQNQFASTIGDVHKCPGNEFSSEDEKGASSSEDEEVEEDKPARKARVNKETRGAIVTFFENPLPVQVVSRLEQTYTGIKGIMLSMIRKMDPGFKLNENIREMEAALYNIQRGVLAAISALAPLIQLTLVNDPEDSMNIRIMDSIELLAATSANISCKRYANINKNGMLLTKPTEVLGHGGKKVKVYKAPISVKGHPYDNRLLFGGQLAELVRKYNSGQISAQQKQMNQNQIKSRNRINKNPNPPADFRNASVGKRKWMHRRDRQSFLRAEGRRHRQDMESWGTEYWQNVPASSNASAPTQMNTSY